ncbi:MAG: non-hydrolyzing UDP-N-acetylglucosamine 2-epimerase [bacterium]
MIKVVTIVGTRPELIRLSRIIPLLDKYVNHILVHTGQNYDYELNEVFFKDLEIRKPDYFFNVNTTSVGTFIGETIIRSEQMIRKEQPDAILILGDTNSSLAALMAKRMKVPIYHMEAGNRSFDMNVPEEINRKVVDHLADFNLVYTEHSRRHLLAEGLPHRMIYLTGSPMGEVLDYYRNKIETSDILNKLKIKEKEYIVVSLHREENVDKPEHLNKLISILKRIRKEFDKEVIVSTHPRTKNRLEKLKMDLPDNIRFLKPFGFLDYIKLQEAAFCTVSDSGTISEEAAILGFPAITLRNSMERPEAMDAGTIILTGMSEEVVLKAIKMVTSTESNYRNMPEEYKVKNTSERVLNIILGTARLSNKWQGINKND